MAGTARDAFSSSQPRTPVPMEAKRTVSLGATAGEAPQSRAGSRRVGFAPAPDSTAPVPICMKRRRDHDGLLIADSPISLCGISPGDYGTERDGKMQENGNRWSQRQNSSARYNAAMISKELLDILVCQVCKKTLAQKEGGTSLKCSECHRV